MEVPKLTNNKDRFKSIYFMQLLVLSSSVESYSENFLPLGTVCALQSINAGLLLHTRNLNITSSQPVLLSETLSQKKGREGGMKGRRKE